MYREGMERDRAHVDDMQKAQRVTDEALVIASAALTVA